MPVHVLILDDSATVRTVLASAFATVGYEVLTAETLGEARRILGEVRPALVVLDIHLPDGDGCDLLSELKARPETQDVPVMMLTIESEVRARVHGLALGAIDYIGKPFDTAYVVLRAGEILAALQESAPAQPPTVLVIDDSRTFREAMRMMLEDEGLRVLMANTGEEGLRIAAVSRPDLAIIDGHLPGIDGATVVRRIRMDANLRLTPCLLLTASEHLSDEIAALEAGADAFISKREGIKVIRTRIHALMRSAEADASDSSGVGLLGSVRIVVISQGPARPTTLMKALLSDGYEVTRAESPQEAETLLAVQHISCVILDLETIDTPAIDLCAALRASPTWREVPLVLLGRDSDQDDMVALLDAGADEFLLAGTELETLRGRLRALLRRRLFESEGRRVRDAHLKAKLEVAEARAAHDLAETQAAHLAALETKNAELEAAMIQAEAATKAKTEFLAVMSHEIRTPLNSILGMADMLGQTSLDERQARYVRLFSQAGNHLMLLINDILDISKIEAGQLELERTPFSLSDVVERTVEMVGVRAHEKGLTMTSEIDPAVGDLRLADPHRLAQVLNNLLGNAVKFTPNGSVHLRVTPEASLEDGVRLEVEDTGIGVPPEHLETIFDRFAQAESSTTRRFGGTGLGLAITQQLAERMGGRVWAQNRPEGGACFTVLLSLPPAAAPNVTEEPHDVPLACPTAGFRILLAEDSEDNQAVFSAYLEGTPHVIDLAENGALALERFFAAPYDLVFMDMLMPVMDGYQATRTIRDWEAQNSRPPVPILALTAYATREQATMSLAAGCNAHLAKPISRHEVLSAIAHWGGSEATAPDTSARAIGPALAKLVPKYLARRRAAMPEFLDALATGDRTRLATLGHALAGSGSSYGFPGLSRLGRALEQQAATAPTEALESLLAEITRILDRAEAPTP